MADTIEQALKNFQELGFTDIRQISHEPAMTLEEARVEFGVDPEKLDGKAAGLVYDVMKEIEGKVTGRKAVDFYYAKSLSIFGEFYSKYSRYSLVTSCTNKDLQSISMSANGSDLRGQFPTEQDKCRFRAQRELLGSVIIGQLKDCSGEPDLMVKLGCYRVEVSPTLRLWGSNLNETYEKFFNVLNRIYGQRE
ncbi:MAG: hypothetical protein WCI72_01585 [archaeon]